MIDVEIDGKKVEMIIDTGCARTLVPKQLWVKFSVLGGGELKCFGTIEAKWDVKTKRSWNQCLWVMLMDYQYLEGSLLSKPSKGRVGSVHNYMYEDDIKVELPPKV